MKSKSLLVIEVISAAFAYKMLNELTENSWLEIVEVSSGSNAKNLLLFQTDDSQKLKSLYSRIEAKYGQPGRRVLEIFSPQLYDNCFIEEAHPDILPALSGLLQNSVGQSLIIFETESICGLLKGIDLSLKNGLKICDLKVMRQSGGMNHVFLTGAPAPAEVSAEALRQLLFANYMIGQVELIATPTPQIKEFFGFGVGELPKA